MRVLVGLMALALTGSAAAESVCDLLKRQTQEFSDAGQAGDIKTMDRLLDADVVFFNEGGDRATKADMIAPGAPPPAGVKVTMSVMDWNCAEHGDAAVANFIDDQQLDFHGQAVHAKFRSVETWLKETDGAWRMIGSQTLAVQDDPAAMTLPPDTLDQYVGIYQAAPGAAFAFTRQGDGIAAALNGGPATPQLAEVKDVLFTPGRARFRKVFERDAAGKVTGFLYRHEGHDIRYTKVACSAAAGGGCATP